MIRPGCVVLDIGTGAGIWALLACKFGARKVYAVDKNPAIGLAHELAALGPGILGVATTGSQSSEGGLNPRQSVKASVGEDLLLEWRCESEFPHGAMRGTVIRIFAAQEAELGQRPLPPME